MSAPLGGSSLSSDPDRASGQAGPGVVHALGLILLYFILQLGAGTLLSLVLGAIDVIQHPGEKVTAARAHVMSILRQPDVNTLLMLIALPLIAIVLLYLIRRTWPSQWAIGAPPGFGLVRALSPNWYAMAILVGLIMPPLGGVLTELLAHGEKVSQNVVELGRATSASFRLPLALIAVVVGPLVEELLFRGVLLSALLRRLSTGWAVLLCSVLFGAVHLEGLSYSWYALPNLMLLAIALCWLRLRSRSLWPAVLAHAVYNLFAFIALFAAMAVQHT